ncbi:hypothetical protein D6855_12130 [Butyrivibrio sp. CB08]|uniref:hypothetical protein n=1 Tax=Butyrivibrio sp. CB08 TaxID=2364879 RepID=UPI000EA98E64|nr:hypothetical protein [Butyrivibrio sp. CB08]RKM58897.1 hypothetical protein D6855_12130 [Butyrivibrio sp. CB08]
MMGNILAIFDQSEIYSMRLSEYLREHLKLAFEIQTFSVEEEFNSFLESEEVSLLVASSLAIQDSEDLIRKRCGSVMILEEEDFKGPSRWDQEDGFFHMSKFLPAGKVLEKILEVCMERPERFPDLGIKHEGNVCKVIGLYTPLSGSGQTTLAVQMGEQLSKNGKAILISFESFSALTKSFDSEALQDISDMMYYADCERDKFCIYLEKIKVRKYGLDYIAPAKTAMQIKEMGADKVRDLIALLAEEAGYEYVILDLKDYPDGFFEILNMCDVLYTINRNNSADQYRMGKYNRVLCENGYEDVLSKTIKCLFPDEKGGASYKRYVRELIEKGQGVLGLGA